MQLTYIGNCLAPILSGVSYRQFTFNGSEGPLSVCPDGTLVVRGHGKFPEFARLSVPSVLNGRQATVVGAWFDPTNGQAAKLGVNHFPRGYFVDSSGDAWGTVNLYYNAANSLGESHYRRNLFGTFDGFYQTKAPRLKTAGYICELPARLKQAWNARIGFGETIPQGTAGTNSGPSLYSWNGEFPIRENARLTWDRLADDIYQHGGGRPWAGDCQINSMSATADELTWAGRTPTADAVTWYGEATVSIDGVTYVDKWKSGKGYHANGYRPVLFCASCDDLIAGRKTITEIELSPWLKSFGAQISACIDQTRGLLYVQESYADPQYPTMPVFHVFRIVAPVKPPSEVELLKAEIVRLTQRVDELTAIVADAAAVLNRGNK